MKNFFLTALVISTFIVSLHEAKAQIDLGTFLEGGVEDGNRLLENYMEPAFVGFGTALNSGWYNTAKPHKLLGFDLTVNVNLAYVPSSAEFFTFNPSEYDNVSLTNPGQDQFPTFMGPNIGADEIPFLTFTDPETGEELLDITGPTGLGMDEVLPFNVVPAPVAQLGIGLFKNTELKLRLLPEQTFGDPGEEFSISMFGLGVMHDVKQWIPGMKLLPFDLSAFVGFNNLSVAFDIDEDAPDQRAEMDVNGFTFQGVISKDLALLTVYAGLGFITSSTDFRLLGEYQTEAGNIPPNPINLSYSSSSPRFNVGARLKLLVLTLHAEYALQEYNTLTAGVGISVR